MVGSTLLKRKAEEIGGLPGAIFSRQCNTMQRAAARRVLDDHYAASLPTVLQEVEIGFPNLDKAFACEWHDSETILIGTKCNTLLSLHLPTHQMDKIALPPAPPRDFPTDNPAWGRCGIHCVTTNAARDLVATGGTDPADCVVLRTSDWSPVQTLVGHRDWVFGTAWVTDRHVVTGSRDGSTALWRIDPDGEEAVQRYDYHNPKQMKRKAQGKVRAVQFVPETGLLVAMSTDGTVMLQNPAIDLRVVRSLEVRGSRELVSMAASIDLVAVGGLDCVSMLDPRQRGAKSIYSTLTSPDVNHGVRSICINGHVLSYGTGKGKLCFFDLRTGGYLPVTPAPGEDAKAPPPRPQRANSPPPNVVLWHWNRTAGEPQPEQGGYLPEAVPPPQQHLRLGLGWVADGEREQHWHTALQYHDAHLQQACYAHAWDATGTRLFACGGPLAFGLRGGYVGLWE